jgi:hypothetical protein
MWVAPVGVVSPPERADYGTSRNDVKPSSQAVEGVHDLTRRKPAAAASDSIARFKTG